MDYHKALKEERQMFLDSPRESINNFLENTNNSINTFLQLDVNKSHPELILLFKQIHLEYANLLGSYFTNISGKDLLEDNYLIGTIQRIQEAMQSIKDWSTNSSEVSALRVARCFSSYLELIWKKLKKIVSVAGLNPDDKFLNIQVLKEKLESIEQEKQINITMIKNFIDSNLRNSVGHEDTVFVAPNKVSFRNSKGSANIELALLTIDELNYNITKFTTVLGAMQNVEMTLIASKLEPLLKLTDDLLLEYMKTGIMTNEMAKVMQDE